MKKQIINNISGNIFNGSTNIITVVTNNIEEHKEKTVVKHTAETMRKPRSNERETEDDE